MDLLPKDMKAFVLGAPRDRTAAEPLQFTVSTWGADWAEQLGSQISRQAHLYANVDFNYI